MLNEIVRHEYAEANVDPCQVATGAVIITGETAKKKNADAILQEACLVDDIFADAQPSPLPAEFLSVSNLKK